MIPFSPTRKAQAVLLALTLSFLLPLQAAEEYTDQIPADLLKLLMDYGNQNNFAVYDGIMEEFPEFDVPSGFTVHGGLRQSVSLRVALQTGLPEAEATAALISEFSGRDWIQMPQFDPTPFGRDNGFISPEDPTMRSARESIRLCHDEQGQLSLNYLEQSGNAYVMLSASNSFSPFGSDLRSCQERISQQEESMAMQRLRGNRGLQAQMPRMVLPVVDDSARAPIRVGGFSGSNREMETDARIQIDWDMEDLFADLAEQISAQDWTLDSESMGEVSATGTWLKSVAGEGDFIGTLSIVTAGDERYDLRFVIRRQGSQRGGVFIRGN